MKYTTEQIEGKLTEVFESTLQSKSVDVSADTTITADEGFLALKSVDVKVQGGGASYEYIDVREMGEMKAPLALYALAVRFDGAERYTMPVTQFIAIDGESVFSKVLAVMIDPSFVMDMGSDGQFTYNEFFSMNGFDLASLPRLTKEQFYTL